MRIISSFSVVLIHVSADWFYNFEINSYIWKISYYFNGISRWGVPNFLMMSGALFLNKEISYRKIFIRYIKRIFIHLLIWSIIYSLIEVKLSKINIKIMINKIIDGYYHLWYLFITIGLYTITPILREVSKKENILKSFMILFFIYSILLPNFIYPLSSNFQEIYNILNNLYTKLNLNYFNEHYFYFILGYYLNNKKLENRNNRIIIYFLGLIGIIFTTKISYNFAIMKKEKIHYFNSYYLNIFFTSISVFVFFKNNFNIKNKKNFIQKISKYTFGIYLVHPLIFEFIKKKLNIFAFPINIIVLIPMISLIVFVISLIFSICLNYIPFIGKYLI